MHDDIEIHDLFFLDKVVFAHEKYDIVGIAGGASQTYKDKKLLAWHLCLNKHQDGRGFISHSIPKDVGGYGFPYINSTYFGPTPAEVVFIDGVFTSFKTKSLKTSGVVFDDVFTFHHYDMAMCADAKKVGLTIGVMPIFSIHHGLGNFNAEPLWHKTNELFKAKYSDYSFSV